MTKTGQQRGNLNLRGVGRKRVLLLKQVAAAEGKFVKELVIELIDQKLKDKGLLHKDS